MVVCRMTLMVCKKKRSKIEIEKKTKWWKLKKEECCEEFRQKLRQALGGQVVLPDDWETTAEVIRETGRKVLGVSSGRRKEDKETWWWNEEVQDSVQRKRLAKEKWDMDRTEENRQEYKELQHRVKREVSKAKQKAYEELYTRLDTREGQKDLYRLARQRDRDGKDVQQVRVIKDRDGRVLTNLEKAYDRVPREELWYCMRKSGVAEKYVRVVQDMYERSRTVVRCAVGQTEEFKVEVGLHQGSALSPFLFAMVMDQLSGEYRDGQRELHCVFVDLEKAYDRVPREELWYCMRKSGVAEKYVRMVQDMYERNRTVVRCAVGQTDEFKLEVGLHQGSALSPFLFAIVMDQLSEEVRQESPWTMMFADDIVICSESREQVEENLERWRFALERRGMKVSHSKTEYMCVNEREGSGTVRLQGEEVKKVQEFKYLGSTDQSNGECGKEVKKRVQAGWNGWRKVWGVLCDRKISARIKGKVYRTVVRPAMLYGLETVSLRKRQESELEVAELKMLRFSLGVTRLDRIRNEYIRGTAHVGRLGDKVREDRLRWFGHVQRREMHNIIQRFRESGTISVPKGQGRKTILDARDLRALRRHCITYRNATVMEITTWAQEYFQKTLSVNTIHRAIRRCRLKLYRSKKKPYLNMIQKRRRFLWAKAHLKWTVAKWKTVLWSDESKFEVLFGKLGRHVIRTKEDKDNPSCYQRSVQKPASLMVWGCMSVCGMGSLHIWKGTINAERQRFASCLSKAHAETFMHLWIAASQWELELLLTMLSFTPNQEGSLRDRRFKAASMLFVASNLPLRQRKTSYRLFLGKLGDGQAKLEFSAGKSMELYKFSYGWWCCEEEPLKHSDS
ncbi:hypothetical protein QTP70_005447 [Hemibagrus guttatus]|uniref:ribonuclease H n=1 Tax=Hemibagrus guttatus TaxID=175788 RepID=A0AAE0UKB9_9TELE|nr:hypothetical protein QTP70_005447 [Hemibagrus guttatus]